MARRWPDHAVGAAQAAPPGSSRRSQSGTVRPILSEIDDVAALRAADFVLDYPASRYAHAMAALVRQLESRPGSGMAGAAIIAVTTADPMEMAAPSPSAWRAAARMGKRAIMDCAAASARDARDEDPAPHGHL